MNYDYERTASGWQQARTPRFKLKVEESDIIEWTQEALKGERPPEAPSSGDWIGGLKPKGAQKGGEFTFEGVTYGPIESARKVHIEVSMAMSVSYATIQVYPTMVRARLGDPIKKR